MNSTKNLFDYKTKAINKILQNDNIIKALIDDAPQFLDNLDTNILTQNYRDNLLYKQVYPYLPVTSVFKDAKSYITLSLGIFKSSEYAILSGQLRINVICHMDLIQTENGQRHGFIANEIDNMMFNTNGFGIGKLGDKRIEEIIVGSDHIGVAMQYNITDFAI